MKIPQETEGFFYFYNMKQYIWLVLFALISCNNMKENDEQSIKLVMQMQEEAWNSGNIEQFMQGYWQSDSLMFIGKNGIKYGWQTTLDNLFPTAKTDNLLPSLYNGYQIDIIKEEVVDEGIKLLRRRVIVADQRGITVYEGTPTYATDDQVLIKEGQYYIDKQGNVGTSDEGNSFPTNQEVINKMNELGLNPNNVNVNPNDLD